MAACIYTNSIAGFPEYNYCTVGLKATRGPTWFQSDGIQYSSFYYSVRRVIDPIEMNQEVLPTTNYQLPPDTYRI